MGDNSNDGRDELERLRMELAQARSLLDNRNPREETALEEDRFQREATVESAFGGNAFKATGMAAWDAFKKFEGRDGSNP
ncbi:hypothetical protein CIB48_g266 [Xylaria polymorpha]|nr:hypothetical protein CIB48_g266 [Xylaria polymorpha]